MYKFINKLHVKVRTSIIKITYHFYYIGHFPFTRTSQPVSLDHEFSARLANLNFQNIFKSLFTRIGKKEMNDKVVFITVGTTKFDELVSTITQKNALQALKQRGYVNLIIQLGHGTVIPNEENCKQANLNLSYYKFKNSIYQDIIRADLVISHAGAGTCLEVLAEKKPLLVVVNENLMGNHQIELADQLSSEGYLFACTCSNVVETIKTMNLNNLKKMLPAQSNVFANYLNQFMGFEKTK